VGLERRLVPVDLVEQVVVGVLPVADHVEAQATGLVADRADGVVLDRLQEAAPLLRLDLGRHDQYVHLLLPVR
jgi:hypothetical protein